MEDIEQVDIHRNNLILTEIAEEIADFIHGRLNIAIFRRPKDSADIFAGVRIVHLDHPLAADGRFGPVSR